MKLFSNEWKDRIAIWIRSLEKDLYLPLEEIAWETAADQAVIAYEDAAKLHYTPVSAGFRWGKEYEYRWFRAKVTLPASAEGERIVLNLQPGHESTVFVDGKPFGTYRDFWVKTPYHFMVDNTLSVCGTPGEIHEVCMEVYSGHFFPTVDLNFYTGPILPDEYTEWPKEDRVTLGVSTYGIWNEEAYQLMLDVLTLKGLLEELDPTSLRAAKIAKGLREFTLVCDFEQETALRRESYRKAREVLAPLLACTNGSTMPTFSAIGNAHLDYVWVWPEEETIRKTARTFAAQVRLMDEYPEYRFLQSMPALYKLCKEYYPEVYSRVKEKIAAGQWIAEGAMYVEPDTNLASGESLIRQIYYGQKFYEEEFGKHCEILWLPDTFGYSAVLPQILKKSGIRYLVTQKIFWSYNDGDKFPYHYFTWRGMDGSSVTSFLPTGYDYQTHPQKMNSTWKERVQRDDLEDFLIPHGYGDGGGGPTRDHLEYIKRQRDLEGGVRLIHESPVDFFHRLDAKGGPVNTFDGELYLNTHRGTFTVQARIKQLNRQCDTALHNLEYLASCAMLAGAEYPHDEIDELWMLFLKNQFHDILPGSSIHKVYVRAEAELESVIERAEKLMNELAEVFPADEENGVRMLNTISFERGAMRDQPTKSALKPVEKGKDAACCEAETGPAGEDQFVAGVQAEDDRCRLGIELSTGSYRVTTDFYTVVIRENGEILSMVLNETGKEYADAPLNHFRLFQDIPRMFDAWDIDSNYEEKELSGAFSLTGTVVENSGERFVLDLNGAVSKSTLNQSIVIEKQSPVILFDTEIDWKETHRLLKTSFPTSVRTNQGINEIQFGYVKRPTTRNNAYEQDRFEVCNYRYSALCDSNSGIAVLNDCKYGIGMKDGTLELSLLRAPGCPDLEADRRVHRFRYGIMAFAGEFAKSDVVRQAYILNIPEVILPGRVRVPNMCRTSDPRIIIETVKAAYDRSGDVVLRLYESSGGSVSTELVLPEWVGRCEEADMMENRIGMIEMLGQDGQSVVPAFSFTPFEIKTLRLVRKVSKEPSP